MRRDATRICQTPPGAKVDQYAALCTRSADLAPGDVEVLLITGRDTGRWVIPKGWPMSKKKPHQVAKQEAWEEAGVRGRVSKLPLGHYTYDKKISLDEVLPCLVQVYLLMVSEVEDEFPEKGQRRKRWCSPADAALAVNEPGLQQLLFNLGGQNADV
ncbi:DNA mismatch repair protein MutT [Agrobacterium tumefaciens]|jgi:8-oxo-dGTP pyrophosphatase MutT (NUDIX family)|uniref:Orf_Bo224 n=2 Tax=Agrobacterium tumefaciens complex TaxID=1183400 RepID=A5WYD9_AGRTU|nr:MULTISPECIES: NUDIX hydrolase [Agrobacterium]AAZ50607.1 orf_Bo224 [Agrobacterium tumefaciens]ASK40969.1 DNA mismatch repair protein MutT [Agrobacterium genomosp. 6]ASK42547.1 DNA mismatch repair protein MutT [Agrobacterium sp.]KEY50187.1 DNA mismatch repair protein MutT [Agrobacterium tumefaciens]QQN14556.1 NUDIX hydrolase [Agrobacterium fabrum]